MYHGDRERFTKQAKAEWAANAEGCNSKFVSEKTYIGWRVNNLNQLEKSPEKAADRSAGPTAPAAATGVNARAAAGGDILDVMNRARLQE